MMADEEARTATLFRQAAIAVLVASGVFVAVSGLGILSSATTVGGAVQHLAVLLAGAGLSGYLAAEAGRHRHVAQWSATSAVQLKTVSDFCAPLDAGARDAVMQTLASRVFGMSGQSQDDKNPPATMTPALLEQVLAIVRAGRTT